MISFMKQTMLETIHAPISNTMLQKCCKKGNKLIAYDYCIQ